MKNFSNWLETKMLPLANKIAKQKYLKAISNTFMSIIPFMTIGSIALVLVSPVANSADLEPGLFKSFIEAWEMVADMIALPVGSIYTICMECIAIFVAAGIGYFLSQHYKMKGFTPTILSIISFLILGGLNGGFEKVWTYAGGTGLFTAIFSSILSIELLHFLVEKKFGKISLEGHGVPEALTESFAMLFPCVVVLLVVSLLHTVVSTVTGSAFPALMQVIMSPLLSATNSIFGGVILVFLVMTLWWFGIHDTAITGPMGAFWAVALSVNIAAFAGGAAANNLPYVITEPFWWFFIMIGGSGATFGLVFVLMFVCKSKQLKTVGKLGLVPAFFNINEPIIFGVPLMMNPLMYIPFVGVPVLNCIISYLAISMHLVNNTIAYPGWNMFCPVAALISTADIKAMLLVVALIVIDALFYLPFIKVLDKQKLLEEAEG